MLIKIGHLNNIEHKIYKINLFYFFMENTKINKNILICGVIKNVVNQIGTNIQLAIKTLEYFNKGKIIIYENNSTDGTKQILESISKSKLFDDKLKIISEDIDLNNCIIWSYKEITGSDHSCKIEFISKARNKVIDEFNKTEYDDYEYIIWIDFDALSWEIDGIIDSFNRKENWDVLFGNTNGDYYDYFALRYQEQLFGPEILGEYFWSKVNYKTNFNNSDNLIPVYSAFNGIGIYKKKLFKNLKYNFLVNEQVKLFYTNLIKEQFKNNPNDELIKIIENKCNYYPTGFKNENSNIFWKANSGYNMPIICEHVSVNLALYNYGYKLFINPKMIYHR